MPCCPFGGAAFLFSVRAVLQKTKQEDKTMKHEKLIAICEGALCVALAYALSLLELDLWYQGGSIGLCMLPLAVYAWRRGTGWGVMAGLAFGVIKCILGKGVAYGWQSMLLDYFVAFAAVGLAGLTRKAKHGLALGALVGGAARFAVHFISGVTIYKIMEPTELYGLVFSNPWVYSLAYNIGYMLPSTLLAALVCLLLEKPMSRLPGGSRA